MPTTLSGLSIDALECITRRILGPDVIRLYLCGSQALNASLEKGGVGSIDFASPVPCGSYKRGKRVQWPDPELVYPFFISKSLGRFRHLRSLQQAVNHLEKLDTPGFFATMDSLVELQVVCLMEQTKPFPLYLLPANLVKVEFVDRSEKSNALSATKKPILPLLGAPKSLHSVSAPVGWFGSTSLRSLPPNLVSLGTCLIESQQASQKVELLPRGLQEARLAQAWTVSPPGFLSEPDYFPPSLVTLELSARVYPDFQRLPITLTDLRMNATQPQYAPVEWEPLHLLVLHLSAPSYFTPAKNGSTAIDSPIFEWIYKNKSITNLSLTVTNSAQRKQDPLSSRFRLSKLPTSVIHLSFNIGPASQRNATASPHILPANLPSHLHSLQLGAKVDDLVNFETFDEALTEESVAHLRKPFEALKQLTLSMDAWRFPHCSLLGPALTTLSLRDLSWEIISTPEFCSNLPITLTSIRLFGSRVLATPPPLNKFLSLLPNNIKHIEYDGPTLAISATTQVTWPTNLTRLDLRQIGCCSTALTSLPASLQYACFSYIYIENLTHIPQLESWFSQHPNATIFSPNWTLYTDSPVSPSPANMVRFLSAIPEIVNGQWLKNMRWTVKSS